MNTNHFKAAVCLAWEEIAQDAGSEDGEGAVNHLEVIFFRLQESSELDKETLKRVCAADPELKQIARVALKKYG